jgi:hypothetical protein
MLKNTVLFLFVALFVSCKRNEREAIHIPATPKLFFDGKRIIDKKRNDSIICDLDQKVPYPINYKFDNSFDIKEELIKNKDLLKINKIKSNNNIESYYSCGCNIDVVLKKALKYKVSYDLLNKNGEVSATILIYSFKTKSDLLYAFKTLFNYTKFLRELKRDKYEFRCCETKLDNTYYTAINGNKLYLISSSYNFHYPAPNYNLESEIKQNKEIIIDDVFKLINEK